MLGRVISFVAAGLIVGAMVGCDSWNKPTPPSEGQGANTTAAGAEKTSTTAKLPAVRSLYDRLGKEAAITAVCEDFVERAAGDPSVNFFRKNVDGHAQWKPSHDELSIFKKHLVQFICVASGGPQKYDGRDMKSVHQGMKITSAEFDALAKDLAMSLDRFKVPAAEKAELLAIVGTTKNDIVER